MKTGVYLAIYLRPSTNSKRKAAACALWILDGAVTYQLSRQTRFDGAVSYGLGLPRLNDDDLPDNVADAPLNQNFGANATLAHQFNKTAVEGRAGLGRSQTGPTKLDDDSLIDNGDQNSWTFSLGGRASREITPILSVFLRQ